MSASIHPIRVKSAPEAANTPDPLNDNQGRESRPRRVDGSGIVIATVAGLAIWCFLALVFG
jgi:hypothetical protein